MLWQKGEATVGSPTEAASVFLEPGQGLAGVTPEQPIVLAVAGIEHGQWHRDVAAIAASLSMLRGLALLADLSAFRKLAHCERALLRVGALLSC
jgi:hypothetical protein